MAAGAAIRRDAAELDQTLALARRGRARRQRAAAPVHAGERRTAAARARCRPIVTAPAPSSAGARLAARLDARSSRCSRSQRRDRQPHPPGRCASRPTRSSSRRRRRPGSTRIVTVGTDGASCRAALAAAEAFPQVYAAIGRHPNEATGFDDADLAELRGARRAREVRGDRRDRPRLLPRLRPARRPGARVRSPRSSSRASPASRS